MQTLSFKACPMMSRLSRVFPCLPMGCGLLMLLALVVGTARAEDQPPASIAAETIAALRTQLTEATEAPSTARQKLALRRVVREAEALIQKSPTAPNRFEVMEVMFRTQLALFQLEADDASRQAILQTCAMLVQAPDEYALLRWDADLLLSQSQVARQGGDAKQRARMLRELVERYLGTSAETKAVRTTMVLALEVGESGLIEYLDTLINEQFAGDLAMIAYKREKLPERVFGVTLFADLRDAKGNTVRFPSDGFGTTTALFFWSNDEQGQANLKEIAEVLKTNPPAPERRLVIYSVNLDALPDAGESILRQHGLDWPALHLPGGRTSLIYQAYARVDPKFVTVSPTGIASLFLTGGNMDGKGFERWIGSSTARDWVDPYYCNTLQSLASAEFLILDSWDKFDPAVPPELLALSSDVAVDKPLLNRTDKSVPEATARAIQACFLPPPRRYNASYEEVIAGYQKAQELCEQAIKAHPDAPDLWMIRNRRIVALMGLWKVKLDNHYLNEAAAEAQAALNAGYPAGADAVARLCLARLAVREPGADVGQVIRSLVQTKEGEQPAAPAIAVAALLAMELGDRETYARMRQMLLERHGNEPMLWPLTAFMLDRYYRYWLYQIPFVSGHLYSYREAHGISSFETDPSVRHFDVPLQSLDNQAVRLPEQGKDQWNLIRFILPEHIARLSDRPDPFAVSRPLSDIRIIDVILSEDTSAIRDELAKRKTPPYYPVLCVSDAVRDTIDRKFGMRHGGRGLGMLILRPDGSVALAASALTHQGMDRGGEIVPAVFLQQDEAAVDRALSKGDLEEAKRLAFANAPAADQPLPGSKLANEHLRARAKVYVAMGDLKAALADVEFVHGRLMEHAGVMGMRTTELDEIEELRDRLLKTSGQGQ